MDVSTAANAFVSASAAQVQIAAAAKMMKINSDAASSIIQVIESAQNNMKSLASLAAGIGGHLDISV